MSIQTLEQVAEVLELQGYNVRCLPEEAVMLDVGGAEKPFAAVITKSEDGAKFVVTCQLAELGDIDEALSGQFMLAALDANTQLCPYALAIISDADQPELENEDKWPIVLTSSMPIGDLSSEELTVSIDELWQALTIAGPVLKLGIS